MSACGPEVPPKNRTPSTPGLRRGTRALLANPPRPIRYPAPPQRLGVFTKRFGPAPAKGARVSVRRARFSARSKRAEPLRASNARDSSRVWIKTLEHILLRTSKSGLHVKVAKNV
jgi:hypothetical protein